MAILPSAAATPVPLAPRFGHYAQQMTVLIGHQEIVGMAKQHDPVRIFERGIASNGYRRDALQIGHHCQCR